MKRRVEKAMGIREMTAGTGMASAATLEHRITKINSLYKLEILIDLAGLECGGSNNDIIGGSGLANCHFGQILAGKVGTIRGGFMVCLEAPAGGDPDINVYSATESTGVEDALITGLTETALCNSGDLSAGSVIGFTANPAANEYLYLACGTTTAATYTTGIIVITFYGT